MKDSHVLKGNKTRHELHVAKVVPCAQNKISQFPRRSASLIWLYLDFLLFVHHLSSFYTRTHAHTHTKRIHSPAGSVYTTGIKQYLGSLGGLSIAGRKCWVSLIRKVDRKSLKWEDRAIFPAIFMYLIEKEEFYPSSGGEARRGEEREREKRGGDPDTFSSF